MKGVSPVIATVLMVAVAIAAAVVAYSWFMSMQASVQAEASRGASTVGKERFIIEAVKCEKNGSEVNSEVNIVVSLRNVGDEPLDGNFTVEIKDASTGISKGAAVVSLNNLAPGTATELEVNVAKAPFNASDCNDLPQNIIVAVTSPGGTTNTKKERIW